MLKTMLDASTLETTPPMTPAPRVAEAIVPTLESTVARIVADALEHPLRYVEQTIVDAEGE